MNRHCLVLILLLVGPRLASAQPVELQVGSAVGTAGGTKDFGM